MKLILLISAMLAFALPASSSELFVSVEERSDGMIEQLQGDDSYHAHLARQLADIALEEKAQHDISVAKAFMSMAEAHAAQAGGAK